MSVNPTFFGLPRSLIPIYIITFLDVLGLTILIPMLPALAQKLHSTPAMMGVAVAITAICATISSPFWGRLSDKVSRKTVLQASQTFSFVGYILLALASSLPVLFISRAIEGFGGGNLGVAQSYVADVTKEEEREKAYAFGAAAFGFGFVVGPVVAGQLLRLSESVPFLTAAGLQAVNFLLTHFYLERTEARKRAKGDRISIVAELRTPPMLNLMGRQFLYIFSFTYFFTVFSLYLERELHMDPSNSSLFLAVAGGVGAAVQIFATEQLNQRFGEWRLSQGAFVLGFVAYAAMFFIGRNLTVFVAILVVWAISGSILRPTLNELIAAAASDEQRGAIMGFADSLNNFSMIVAPVAGGVVLGLSPIAIGILPAIAIAGAFMLGLIHPKEPEKGHERSGETSSVASAA